MKLQTLKIKDIHPYERNARKNDQAVDAVVKSIEQCSYVAPIVVDENHVILAGHTRWKALKKLGRTECECIVKDGLTEEQKKKYRLLDNKTNELADWDFDLLEDELEGLDFGDLEIDWGIESEAKEKEVVEDDYEVEVPEEPKAKLGQIYQLGRNRLMCGDSLDEESVKTLLSGNKCELLMTDQPYGIDADKMTMGSGKKDFHRGNWDSKAPPVDKLMYVAEKHCFWGGNYFTKMLPPTNDWLCWWKKNDNLSFSEFELAWTDFGRNCRHISHHWGKEKKLHVTMKPVAVIAWAIDQSKTSGTVIDLFGGSGSTLIACEQLNRTCYMMELDPKYVDVIIDRWEQFTGEKAVLIEEV